MVARRFILPHRCVAVISFFDDFRRADYDIWRMRALMHMNAARRADYDDIYRFAGKFIFTLTPAS